jgi:hypothetical protein
MAVGKFREYLHDEGWHARSGRPTTREGAVVDEVEPEGLESRVGTGDDSADRPFLQRPVTIVTLVGGLVGIVAAVVGIVVTLSNLGSSSSGNASASDVERCMAAHGLERETERTDATGVAILFRQCSWPAPVGAEADGYSEILITSRDGPGKSEAEGLTIADVLSSSCRDIELIYLFNNQGTMTQEDPVVISKGETRRVEGGSVVDAPDFQPGRDESIVFSNTRYTIDAARCI